MALKTTYEIMDEVLVRANVTTTAATRGLYTDTILRDWVDQAHQWAAAYKKWPVTEGRISTTWTGTEINDYPEGWKPDSIRYMTVGGDRMQKLNFADYQMFRENTPDSEDRVFSDFGLSYYVNPNADVSGTTWFYGQYLPRAFDMTDETETTVFSNRLDEANEAIVEEILKYAKLREKKPDEASVHHQRAIEVLETLWKKIQDEQFGYQTKNRGMYEYFDVLEGELHDRLIRRDQWY